MSESEIQGHTHEPEEIKAANYILFHSFIVYCPYCTDEIISEPDEGLPFTGQQVECMSCEQMFELGEAQ